MNLLADPAKLFKTRMTNDEALRDLRSDAEKYAEWNYRIFSCDAEVDTQHGAFECDTVETRTPKAGARELSVFRMRFEYGPPNLKYSVFADPVRITRKWLRIDPPCPDPLKNSGQLLVGGFAWGW